MILVPYTTMPCLWYFFNFRAKIRGRNKWRQRKSVKSPSAFYRQNNFHFQFSPRRVSSLSYKFSNVVNSRQFRNQTVVWYGCNCFLWVKRYVFANYTPLTASRVFFLFFGGWSKQNWKGGKEGRRETVLMEINKEISFAWSEELEIKMSCVHRKMRMMVSL